MGERTVLVLSDRGSSSAEIHGDFHRVVLCRSGVRPLDGTRRERSQRALLPWTSPSSLRQIGGAVEEFSEILTILVPGHCTQHGHVYLCISLSLIIVLFLLPLCLFLSDSWCNLSSTLRPSPPSVGPFASALFPFFIPLAWSPFSFADDTVRAKYRFLQSTKSLTFWRTLWQKVWCSSVLAVTRHTFLHLDENNCMWICCCDGNTQGIPKGSGLLR